MAISIEHLNKIRSVSFDELRVRSRQRFARLSDRLRRCRAREMSDEELFGEFNPVWREGRGGTVADALRDCLRAKDRRFLPSLELRSKIVGVMNHRFPDERDSIIKSAEAALAGKFSLLGHANLSFGSPPDSPIDWSLDPVSGKRCALRHWSKLHPLDPLCGGDPKVVWELNRHAHFVTLGQAYWLTNDDRFAAAFVEQVSAWIDANPVGMGINWASSLEVAFRSISWLWALSLCVDSREVTSEFFARLLKSLIAHGRHIERYLSYYFSPNTHLTGEALGLFYIGLALPELGRAEGWRDLGLRILLDQAPKQVRPDGVYFEQSSYYHRYTTDFYTHLLALTRAHDVRIDRGMKIMLRQKLGAMLDHLMWITRPDGSSPLFGDDDGGRLIKLTARAANDFRDTLAIGAALLKRGEWKYVAGQAPAEMLWLIGPEGVARYDRLKVKTPSETSKEFRSSGYFVMRDGWSRDSSFVLIDCGPHGAAVGAGHAHSDALSIEFVSRGVTWLVDPGAFVYAADAEMRDEFRSTAAHNTVMVDGQPQSIPSTPFSWRTIANCRRHEFIEHSAAIFFQGSHDGYERLHDPVTHTRSALFLKPDKSANLPGRLIVRDQFAAKKRHRYSIRYHFAPDCEATVATGGPKGSRVEARHATGATLTIRVICETELQTGIAAYVTEGLVSTCYAQYALAPVAVFEAEGVGTQEFLTLIFPGEPGPLDRIARDDKSSLYSLYLAALPDGPVSKSPHPKTQTAQNDERQCARPQGQRISGYERLWAYQ
ncbi:MAG TPA: alginate lyase family protein [Blastocatellia bacterium]|nr:alginate lyase family protein [Blastocatellia bacterium]